MAVDLTSLGGHRLPVRRYEGFERTANRDEGGVDDALFGETQTAVQARAATVAESVTAVAAQSASVVGEEAHGDNTSLGGHRLPVKRYVSFVHDPIVGVVENNPLTATQLANSSQAVARAEVGSAADATSVQTVIPDSVSETLTPTDTVDAGTTRFGALVSTMGAMGVPRARWVDFIHPAGVEETAAANDSQDASIPGEDVAFASESLSLVAAQNSSATFNGGTSVSDDLDLFDSSTTGSTFAGVIAETATALDDATSDVQQVVVTVNEVSVMVDISLIVGVFLNSLIQETSALSDVPGIAGELYDTVAEAALATAAFDISGAFVPGVNVDGMRTITVAEELREIEVVE